MRDKGQWRARAGGGGVGWSDIYSVGKPTVKRQIVISFKKIN